MRYFFLFFLIFLFSCGYQDIDSVPDFKSTVISKEESIDLCYLYNTDKKQINECLENIDSKE